MMEEKKKKSLLNDYKVIVLILALLIAVVAIGPWYSAEEGFYTRLDYGLDIEGGSWIQLQLNGAVAQVDAAPRDIVAGILKTEYDDGINITGANTDATGTTTVTFQTSSAVNQTRLNYLFSGADVSTRAVGSMTEVTIKDSKIGYIISYLTFV
ncbi:MAG: preprotein translocase subunit SecD, partial [Methanimicrococcus sp.]|nr:preprotein translocase subunit SecD [Methanimicrococcus sp.]